MSKFQDSRPRAIMFRVELLPLLCAVATAYKCVHDKIGLPTPVVEDPLPPGQRPSDSDRLLQTAYRPINIVWDFSNLDRLNASFATQVAYTKLVLVPQLTAFMRSFLRVSGKSAVNSFPADACGSYMTIPRKYAAQSTAGDLIIFVGGERNATVSYVAFAGACVLSSDDFRPVVGLVNLNFQFMPIDRTSIDSNLKIVMHELTHVLGFSSVLFFFYPGYSSVTKILGFANGGLGIVTPKTLAFARAHFNCPSLTGVALEDQGGSGSAGSHWEAKYFGNEAMTGQVSIDMVFSGLTLALLEDTNWYKVVTGVQEVLRWGKNRGCDFVSKACSTAFPNFCTGSAVGCTDDYRSMSVCSAAKFMDDCSSYRYMYAGLCDKERGPVNYFPANFQSKGVYSRCFRAINPNKQNIAGCFRSWCTAKGQVLVTVSGRNYTCTATGQKIVVANYTVLCPALADFCAKRAKAFNPCPQDCGGHGTCRADGSCLCDWGYLAPTCTTRAKSCPVANAKLCALLFPPAVVAESVDSLQPEEEMRIDSGHEVSLTGAGVGALLVVLKALVVLVFT